MTKEKKEDFLILRVSPNLKDQLKAIAFKEGKSLSAYVREILEKHGR